MSKGRTSWQSKAEQNDYISFIGFMIYYLHHLTPPSPKPQLKHPRFTQSDPELHDLSPIPSQAVPPPRNNDPQLLSPTSSGPIPQIEVDVPKIPNTQPILLLGGYSYGAMITGALPPIMGSITQSFQSPAPGSSRAEIRMRADCLADQQNELMHSRVASLLSQMQRRGRSLHIEDHILSSPKTRKASGGVRMGGEEDLRRASHESHRSRSSFTIETPERVRKSMDRVRSITKSSRLSAGRANSHGSISASSKKKGSESESSIERIAVDEDTVKSEEKGAIKAIPRIENEFQTAYLLVSPLQGWVSTLATMWSSKSGREGALESDRKFTVDPTLAVFGDDDVFVSVKRLRSWVEKLEDTKNYGEACQFRHREVSGAGHFWHDHEAIRVLQDEVKGFVASL